MMMGQKRERDGDEEEQDTALSPPPPVEQTPSSTEGVILAAVSASSSLLCSTPADCAVNTKSDATVPTDNTSSSGVNEEAVSTTMVDSSNEEDVVVRARSVLSTIINDVTATVKKKAFEARHPNNNSNTQVSSLSLSALLSGGVANWRKQQRSRIRGDREGLVESLFQSITQPITATHHHRVAMENLRREDFPGMEWGKEVEHTGPPTSSNASFTEEGKSIVVVAENFPSQQQQQTSIRIAMSDEMVSVYQILLGAVASLVNTDSSATIPVIPPTSVPINHLLDIFQQGFDIQHPNSQLLRTLITTLCTTTTTTHPTNNEDKGEEDTHKDDGGSQYLILHPMTSSSNFSLRHQSVLYREYNHLEVQIRRKIVLRRLFYTTTATTATVHLDNIMHTHTTREDADYNTASTSKYVFIISGIYVSSAYCALITSAIGVVVTDDPTISTREEEGQERQQEGDICNEGIRWSDECQAIMMGWRGGPHVVLTQEDRRQLAAAFRLKTAGYEDHVNPSSLPGKMYTLQQGVRVHANVATQQ